jgi:hypothetical protein
VLPGIAIELALMGLVTGPLPAHLKAWSPLLELGDRDQNLTTAIVRVASLARLAEAVTNHLDIDDETQALFDNVSKNMGTLDPESMYAMMDTTKSDRREMTVFGELSTKGDYRVVGSRKSRPARFGDLSVEIGMKPARTDTYLLELDIAAHLEVTAGELTGVLRESMDWLHDTANVHQARMGEGLDEADREVGRGLASAFPAMVKLADRYFEPLDGIAKSPGGVRGRIIGRFKDEAFAKDYPELGALLTEEVKTKARAKVSSLDGRTLAMLKLDSARGEGAVIFEVDPDRWVTDKFKVEADIDAELFGLELKVTGIEVQTSVKSDDRALTLRSVYQKVPKIQIGGAALGVVPIALVDAVIPSNVETIVAAFLGALARTDEGRGAYVDVTLPQSRTAPMQFRSQAELLNNGFVSFWLQIASAEIFANEDVLDEMKLLQERCLAAFASDFARFQDQTL